MLNGSPPIRRPLAAAVAATLVLAASAQAAPTWLEPVDLTAESEVSSIGHVAVAPDGSSVVVWEQFTGGHFVVQARRRSPGGSFGPVATVSPLDSEADSVDVATDGAGSATIVWEEDPPGPDPRQIRAALWHAGEAAVGGAQTISDASIDSTEPSLAVASSGRAVIAWLQSADSVIKAAIRPDPASPFGSVRSVSDTSLAFIDLPPAVAVNDAGDAVVAWSRDDGSGTGTFIVEANDRPRNGSFTGVGARVSSSAFGAGSATEPVVVIDRTGRETALWSADDRVRYAERVPGASWSDTAPASPGSASTPVAAIADDGTVVAAWLAESIVQAAVRAPGGAGWTPKGDLSGALMMGIVPVVAVGGNGDAMVAWEPAQQEAVFARRLPKGGSFGPLEKAVGRAAGQPRNFFAPDIGLDDQGNATAVWTRDEFRDPSNFYRLQAAGFDAAPPSLAAVSVPPSGTAGSAIGMAAAATDRWSHLSLHWSFGDGAAASGGAVSHAFGAAGAFDVTVTATDAVGNASSATRPILVAAGPPPPGPPRIESPVLVLWGVDGKRIYLLRLKITKVPKGGKVELRCKGRKCPYKRKSSKRRRKGAITIFKEIKPTKVVGKRKRSFRAGQRLQLRVTAPGHIGKVVKYRLRKGRIPSGRNFCLPSGATKPQKTC